MSDDDWMLQAMELAARGRGGVEPNPMVGAVVVRDGTCVGEGWHQRFGEPHAEVHALTAAGEAARGATMYVTLEPCCHHGKTSPCTDAVLASGVKRVVAAMRDPFPRVDGGGERILRGAGIEVLMGVCEAEARQLNAPYLKLLTTGRPWVHAKWAMTLDGKIATKTGDSKWISNEASRRRVHELRGRMDAILVGIGTALADDPALTARPPGPRTATRIVMDRRGRLPLTSTLVRTAREVPTLIATQSANAALSAAGCEVLATDGSVGALLDELGRRRFTNILIEGGGGVLGAFADARAIDEVHVFIAPKLIGGMGLSPVGGEGIDHLGDALSFSEYVAEMIEGDVYVRGLCRSEEER